MTAIFLALHRDGNADAARADAERMGSALARYGERPPQLSSLTVDRGIAAVAGKRLMPLLPEDRFPDPLSTLGAQTIAAPQWTIAADVRLTAREDLADALGLDQAEGARLSDAMLVALAFERWGRDAVTHIEGPFALIALERTTGQVLLARDFSGDVPLLFHASADGLWAASMPEGLNALAHLPRQANVPGYENFLRVVDFDGADTPYLGIQRVLPGHMATWCSERGEVMQTQHWQPDLTPLRLKTQTEYEDAVRTALEKAVAAALRGVEGEVGAFLSAGFDSTAVVVTAARQLATRGGRVAAFTAVPQAGRSVPTPGHRFADEGPLAALTAAMHPNIDHVCVTPQSGPLEGIERTLPRSVNPASNICNLPWISTILDEAKRRRLAVVLQGGMGNATLSESGVEALPELFRAGRLVTWFSIARGLVRNGWMRWRGVLWNSAGPLLPRKLYEKGQALTGRTEVDARRYSALRDEAYRAAVAGQSDTAPSSFTSVSERLAILASDSGIDRKANLAWFGVDVRDPTVDPGLVRLALRIPVERLCWQGEPRAILRRILQGQAPDEVIHNRKRGYQSADWAWALYAERENLKAEIERLGEYEPVARIVDLDRLRRLVDTMPEPDSPAWGEFETEADYRYAMLRGVSVARHMRYVAGSNI